MTTAALQSIIRSTHLVLPSEAEELTFTNTSMSLYLRMFTTPTTGWAVTPEEEFTSFKTTSATTGEEEEMYHPSQWTTIPGARQGLRFEVPTEPEEELE